MTRSDRHDLALLGVERIGSAIGSLDALGKYVRGHDNFDVGLRSNVEGNVEHTIHDFEAGGFGHKVSSIRVHASPPSITTTEREYSAFTKVNSSLPELAA
jgi:hypothetical protein